MVMQNDILLYPVDPMHEHTWDDLEDSLAAARLIHYASRLLENGLPSEYDLDQALHKSHHGLPRRRSAHNGQFSIGFCRFLLNGIHVDWLVSDLGLQLILLNADVSNPLVAKLQVQILSGRLTDI